VKISIAQLFAATVQAGPNQPPPGVMVDVMTVVTAAGVEAVQAPELEVRPLTYLVVVLVDSKVTVVVVSSADQSPHVSVLVVMAGSTEEDVVQSPQVSVTVLVDSPSTGDEVVQSPQTSVLLVVAGSTGLDEVVVQSTHGSAGVVVVVVVVVEVQSAHGSTALLDVVAGLTGFLVVVVVVVVVLLVVVSQSSQATVVVVIAVVFRSTGFFVVVEVEEVVFQSSQVSRATFS
jgi:hypothetical protein